MGTGLMKVKREAGTYTAYKEVFIHGLYQDRLQVVQLPVSV